MSFSNRPDLGQLKKQAKELLSAARTGDPDAVSRFQIQGLEPTALHQAQWVLAREHGFLSWAKLKEAVESFAASLEEAKSKIVERAWLHAVGPDRSASLRRLLDEFPAVLTSDPWMAAMSGDVGLVRDMLWRDPAWANRQGGPADREPLLYACFSWFYQAMPERRPRIEEVVKLLLEAGADPNASYTYPGNPHWKLPALYGAAGVIRSVPLTRMLLDAGANPNDNESPYHAAEGVGVSTLEPIFERELSPDSIMQALIRKLDWEDPEGIRWMMTQGVSPNTVWKPDLDPALHRAIRRGRSLDVIRILVDAGADLRSHDREGLTPYRLAIRLGRRDAAEYLASLDAAEPIEGIETVLQACATGDPEYATRVAQSVAFPGTSMAPHLAMLLIAPAERGDASVVAAMLAVGFPVDGVGSGGPTPLHHACWQGRVEVARILLEHGANLHLPEAHFKAFPLGWAVHGSMNRPGANPDDHLAIIRLLFQNGATLDQAPADWMEDDALAEPIRAELLAHVAGA